MTEIIVTVITGFAVLGVQYAIFRKQKLAHVSLANAINYRFQVVDAAIHDVQTTANRTGNSLKDHAEESRVSHKASFDVVCSSGQKFANASDALHERANALKVHAQELLDRSETHAITPRQAVSR